MKQGRTRKFAFFCLSLLAILFLFFYIYLNLKKGEISADVITGDDIKIIDLNQPQPDPRKEVKIPILMYHHIRDYNDPNDPLGTNLSVAPKDFQEQINYLSSNGYTTINFSKLSEFPNQPLPEKPIILTFDDGYNDNYLAFEMLKEKNMTGVFYIIYNYLEKNDHLKKQQIKEMSQNGMEIGSHTLNHQDLTKLAEEKLIDELVVSKKLLESIIDKKIITLCYPSGKYNDLVIEKAKLANYSYAVTTEFGVATTSDNNFKLTRIRILHNESLSTFMNKLQSL